MADLVVTIDGGGVVHGLPADAVGALKVSQVDGVGATYAPKLDPVTGALVMIDYAHHEAHDGNHFTYPETNTLALGATRDLILTAPNTAKRIHLIYNISASALLTVCLFENTTHAVAAALAAFNNDRNSATAATMAINVSGGGGADGTLLLIGGYGATGGRQGADVRADQEIILDQAAKYLLRLTSGANGNVTTTSLAWYEE